MMPSRGMGAISPSKMPKKKVIRRTDDPNDVDMYAKGGRVKKFSGDDEESLVKPIASKMTRGEMDNDVVGLMANKKGAFADYVMPKMSRKTMAGNEEDTYIKPVARAGYRAELGDAGVTGSLSKQDKLKMKNITGDVPVGKGKVIAGITDVYYDGEKVDRARNLGYQGRVGGGNLMGMITKPEGRPAGAQLNYVLPFAEGGKAGLYANIHAKRKRIAKGSGEKMRKPGSKGAPTAQAFIKSAKTAKR